MTQLPTKVEHGVRFGVRAKITVLTAGTSAAVAFILIISFAQQTRTVMTDEVRKRGQAVGIGLANNLAFATFSRDTVGLKAAAAATLRDIPDVAWVVLRSSSGEVLADAHLDEFKSRVPSPGASSPDARVRERELDVGGQKVIDFVSPIRFEVRAKSRDPADLDALGMMDLGGDPSAAAAPVGERKEVGLVQVGLRLTALETQLETVTRNSLVLGLLVFLGGLGAAFVVTRMLAVPLERLAAVAAGIARGDLQQAVDVRGQDEIGRLAGSFESMATSLRTMLGDLRAAAGEVQREAGVILGTATLQTAVASGQASAISETSTTMTEIAETSRQASEHADSVIRVTQKSEELAREGQRAVQESIGAMGTLAQSVKAIATTITELSERTLQIGDIIGTVKDLAEQSNLLALNASIEAAKAGEHGRGFAVVAMEMRNLAEQSKVAAGQVRGIISEVQKGTRAAVAATDEGSRRAHSTMALSEGVGAAIEGLTGVIRESSQAARQIAGNTRQQTIGVEQILSAITQLSKSMDESLASTRDIERVAGSLTRLSERLTQLTSSYKV
ncbi:MAG: methyl-accepting chemotaxis protein [Archangium sp.]|nr:methyl-accepting chemotaxis protein [Archangium sp.]MDP3156083.1 methyl-accepting chemotaxis protein [Archangium sp.]MDP3572841.1 methyl-accepting chemotaxis protein [Archangium sp.]